jgi:hypothetical protein
MTEVSRPRPVLAIVICIYEALIVLIGGFLSAIALVLRAGKASDVHAPLLKVALSWAGYALALGIVVTLWMMRREAFYLAATRLVLGLLGLAYSFIHPVHLPSVARPRGGPPMDMHLLIVLGIVVEVFFLAISAAITFYIQHITKPTYVVEQPL